MLSSPFVSISLNIPHVLLQMKALTDADIGWTRFLFFCHNIPYFDVSHLKIEHKSICFSNSFYN